MQKLTENFIKRPFKDKHGELFAQLYDIAFGWDPSREISSLEAIWRKALRKIPSTICDVGAGTGRFTIPLLLKGVNCVAVEPDCHMAAVLEQKGGLLPKEYSHRLKIINSRFEEVMPEQKFDSIIAMTDTASYFWPSSRLRQFAANASNMLKKNGVVILDIGLWKYYEGEKREETWDIEIDGRSVKACCNAILARFGEDCEAGKQLARIEELSFEANIGQAAIYLSREKMINAFTYEHLCSIWSEEGFEPFLCVVPATRKFVDGEGDHKRLLVSFRIKKS